MRFGRWKAASAAGVVLCGGLLLAGILATSGSPAAASDNGAVGCATPTASGSSDSATPSVSAIASPAPCVTPTSTATPTPTRQPARLTLTSSARGAGYQDRLTVTARLSVRDPGARVTVYAQTVGSRTRKLLKKAPVENASGRGDLAITVVPAYSTTFTATFGGDDRYTAATVTRTVDVTARVTQSLAGSYKSERYAGAKYRLYHSSAQLRDAATVAPNKHGECVRFELQIYFQGAWYDDLPSGETATRCGALSRSSTMLGEFSLKDGAGARYRVRAQYVRSRADQSNLSSASSWGYFRVTT